MLTLDEYKIVFANAGLIGILICASPIISLFLPASSGEQFSELWILDSAHRTGNLPFNITEKESYRIYIGVGNHLHSSAYYIVNVKFRNLNEPLPNDAAETPSPLEPIYEYHVFLEDGKNWEVPLTFSFSGVSFIENQSLVSVIRINNVPVNISKVTSWDPADSGYYYQLFVELWIYDPGTAAFKFHNRSVGLWLNMSGQL